MADSTLIEWARHPVTGKGATWNIVTGCDIVSPGCTNCYAMKLAGQRLKNLPSRMGLTRDTKAGPVWTGEVRFNEEWLTQPLKWKTGRGIFVAAHGDLFADGINDAQLDRIFAVMALCPQHVFMVLTKRPERMRAYMERLRERLAFALSLSGPSASSLYTWMEARSRLQGDDGFARVLVDASRRVPFTWWDDNSWPLPNVWLGVSVEDQTRAEERIPILLDTPASIRFISAEPLLGPIDLFNIRFKDGDADILYNSLSGEAWVENSESASAYDDGLPQLDWIIAGGESGSSARPSHPDWFRQLRGQCEHSGVAFFFKQWGSWGADTGPMASGDPIMDGNARCAFLEGERWHYAANGYVPPSDVGKGDWVYFLGKKAAGRTLDGIEHLAFPEVRT